MLIESLLVSQKIDRMNQIIRSNKIKTIDGGYLVKLKYKPEKDLIVITTKLDDEACEVSYFIPYGLFVTSSIAQSLGGA